jgi:hypothetical protein
MRASFPARNVAANASTPPTAASGRRRTIWYDMSQLSSWPKFSRSAGKRTSPQLAPPVARAAAHVSRYAVPAMSSTFATIPARRS